MRIFQHPFEFYQAVAAAINAENRKATVYLQHHAGSLGTAREGIIRRVVREMTPVQFEVRSGFIHDILNGQQTCVSRQCDLLIRDPHLVSPKYEVDGILVASPESVRVAVEVKSELCQATFDHLRDVAKSLVPFQIPLLGFSYDGAAFETIIGYLENSATALPGSLPAWLAIHENNCFFIRGLMSVGGSKFHYRCAHFESSGDAGVATAYFLEFYRQYLNDKTSCSQANIDDWFSRVASRPKVKSHTVPIHT
jgi:hypothetical protein